MSLILLILCSFFAMTTAQDLSSGDRSFSADFPPCAEQCRARIAGSSTLNPCFTTPNNLTCLCDSARRSATAACEKVACSPTEFDTVQTLTQQICSPLYANNTLDASSVSAAITSATAAASAAVEGKDVTDPNDYPDCATACLNQSLPARGCGTLANVSCACNRPPINLPIGRCERQTCSLEDLLTTRYLAFRLCAGVGGPANASEVANQTIATQTAGSVPLPPTGVPGGVVPFTGGVGGNGLEMGGWIVLMGAFALTWMVM